MVRMKNAQYEECSAELASGFFVVPVPPGFGVCVFLASVVGGAGADHWASCDGSRRPRPTAPHKPLQLVRPNAVKEPNRWPADVQSRPSFGHVPPPNVGCLEGRRTYRQQEGWCYPI